MKSNKTVGEDVQAHMARALQGPDGSPEKGMLFSAEGTDVAVAKEKRLTWVCEYGPCGPAKKARIPLVPRKGTEGP